MAIAAPGCRNSRRTACFADAFGQRPGLLSSGIVHRRLCGMPDHLGAPVPGFRRARCQNGTSRQLDRILRIERCPACRISARLFCTKDPKRLRSKHHPIARRHRSRFVRNRHCRHVAVRAGMANPCRSVRHRFAALAVSAFLSVLIVRADRWTRIALAQWIGLLIGLNIGYFTLLGGLVGRHPETIVSGCALAMLVCGIPCLLAHPSEKRGLAANPVPPSRADRFR